ncbi:MAG: hypothetical protein U9N82_10510 [Thermodesulfobacteriota bacterium]|nr:hypothetical protein [Thermodesulfobacteriota bacterium]
MKTGFYAALSVVLSVFVFLDVGQAGTAGFSASERLRALGLCAAVPTSLTSTINDCFVIDSSYRLGCTKRGVEWEAFDRSSPLSRGMLLNESISLGYPRAEYEYCPDSVTFTPAHADHQENKIDFFRIVSDVFFEWSHEIEKAREWIISFGMGVVYQGSPKVDPFMAGSLESDSKLRMSLPYKEEEFVDQFKTVRPLFVFGITYKF